MNHQPEGTPLLKNSIDSSSDAIQIFSAVRNAHGLITDFVCILNNQMAEKLHGDVIGKSLLSIYSEGIFRTCREVTITGHPYQNETTIFQLGDGVAVTTKHIPIATELLRHKDVFIGLASHELKTPVTSIKLYAEAVRENLEKAGDKENTALLERLNEQIDRLTTLINELLDTSRISEGQMKLTIKEMDIRTLLEERIEEVQCTTTHKILLDTPINRPVLADRERIGQVITNLLLNAIKYSPDNSDIQVTAQATDDVAEISISDKGYGIPEEDQPKIFDRFFRAMTNYNDTYPGMGLGLYISAQIIERHNGTIWVKSELGKGSTFYFTVPLANHI
jgi:signal transduction histidine kinase